MLPVARMLDIGLGTCTIPPPAHPASGKIISLGAPTVLVNKRPVAKVGDMVVTTCGGVGIITTGAIITLVKKRPMARVTSLFVGTFTGIIIKGSTNVLSLK